MLNVNWIQIHELLGLYKTTSQKLIRRYKELFERQGYKLIDNKTIPTWFFIKQYSREFGISPMELCKLLGYEYKNYLSYESFTEREIERRTHESK